MTSSFGVVDLFSGPGGLGEGFSAYRDSSGMQPFSIQVSIENEPAAHATLLLRSFLRKFDDGWPDEYYNFLNGKLPEPDWKNLYPKEWKAAEEEARCIELGTELCSRFLNSRIPIIRDQFDDRTILIGGPPCQAYSLAGRSRNNNNVGYVPKEDKRIFLYERYVDVLKKLEPVVFVMENVKGILSSTIGDRSIIHMVLEDLKSALGTDSYRLLALIPENGTINSIKNHEPRDFVVRMEDHGIPQARHRVIILGIRQDWAGDLSLDTLLRLPCHDREVRVKDVIKTMPRLRSGISRDDDWTTWQDTVFDAHNVISKNLHTIPEQYREKFRSVLYHCRDIISKGPILKRMSNSGTSISRLCPEELCKWIVDSRLKRLPDHETRGHMPEDIARYLFSTTYGRVIGRSPKANDFPDALAPNHKNWKSGKFSDRYRVQVESRPASTITSHIAKDGHHFIHPCPIQCRSLTVREVARLQTFPDNYLFKGTRTQQYVQVGNAVPPFLALQIAKSLWKIVVSKEDSNKIDKQVL